MQMRHLPSALALLALTIAPASAQTSSPNASSTNNSKQTQNQMQTQSQTLPQEIKQKLQKQGFTGVEVVPGSFIISAKDKDGDPVNMIIGPHSMMILTSSPVSAHTAKDGNAHTSKDGQTTGK